MTCENGFRNLKAFAMRLDLVAEWLRAGLQIPISSVRVRGEVSRTFQNAHVETIRSDRHEGRTRGSCPHFGHLDRRTGTNRTDRMPGQVGTHCAIDSRYRSLESCCRGYPCRRAGIRHGPEEFSNRSRIKCNFLAAFPHQELFRSDERRLLGAAQPDAAQGTKRRRTNSDSLLGRPRTVGYDRGQIAR